MIFNKDYWSKVFSNSSKRNRWRWPEQYPRDARLKMQSEQSEQTSKRRKVEFVKIWTFGSLLRKCSLASEGWTTIEPCLNVLMQGYLGLSSKVFLSLQPLRPITVENLWRGLFYVLDVKHERSPETLISPLCRYRKFLWWCNFFFWCSISCGDRSHGLNLPDQKALLIRELIIISSIFKKFW